ncbi:MAG: threonine synthase [Candidatus Hodarchaeaceae archaeon]|nr:threonine synthase [Candidatus Hodarchaeaceae archaeon]
MVIKMLRCLKCGRAHEPARTLYTCEKCGGKLEIVYDYDAVAEKIDKKALAKRSMGVWKYRELLPVDDPKNIVTLNEGGTPLLEARNLARELGLKHLWLKDETRNPTASFKDRPMSVGISKAVEFGAQTVVTASSGNAAIALAAYAAKAGIKCYAFVPADAPEAKLAQLSIYGARAIRGAPKGIGDPAYKLMQIAHKRYGWHPIPSCSAFNPYQPEGSKTMSYEIIEQLNWQVPDWVIVPTGAGTLVSGNAKGYFEFEQLDFIDHVPHLAAIQAEGCAPLVRGFKEGKPPHEIPTWPNPKTIAGGLVDPYPWDADIAIPAIRKSEGAAETVADAEILEAEKLLAKMEGIFAEPSGAAGLAGLGRLLEAGVIDRSDVVVVEVTGSGLKDIKIVTQLFEVPPVIEPELKQLEGLLEKLR